jgi:hypothetical protein
MKKLVFIALAIFIALETSAQLKVGIKGGWDFENFDISGSIGNQLKKDKSISWNLGAVAQVKLSGNLYLQPEILYSTQKHTLDFSTIRTDNTVQPEQEYKMSYFQVPANILYKFNLAAVTPYVSGGAYFGYAVSRNDISKQGLKKTNWGVSVGAGIEFLKFQVSAKYNWALQDISEIPEIKWKNNKFNISVAFFIL